MTTERIGWWLLVPSGLAVIFLTLLPVPAGGILPLWCFKCGSLWLADWLLNLIVFLPVGAGLALILGLRKAVVVAAVASIVIELLQRYLIPGRYPSLGDIFSNSSGALLGALFASGWTLLLRPRSGARRALIGGASIGWLALVAFMGWTAELSIAHRALWGQWAPALPHLDRFTGNVLNATLGTSHFPWTLAEDSDRLRAELYSRELSVTATVIPFGVTSRVAPVVSIFDAHSHEVLLLGQVDRAAIFRMRTRASDVGLWSPEAMLPNAFPATLTSRPMTIAVIRRGPLVRMDAVTAGDAAGISSISRLGPATGWTLLLPASITGGPLATLLTTLWLGMLIFPAAYWSGARGRHLQAALLLASIVTLGMLAIPRWQQVAVPGVATWVAAGMLCALGMFTGARYGAERSTPDLP